MTPARLAARLLDWYDRNGRALAWRAPIGAVADPYRVWLSEIMLQQTTVATVGGYFDRFLSRWPGIDDLAAADLDEVLHAWQGLGYYARARNLHRCAHEIVAHHGGRFPKDESALLRLPGIGPYTAAAIAAIAFDRPANVVDGNVERVVARLRGETTPLPAAKPALRRAAGAIVPKRRPGDYAQALMDLGATVCIPARPRCSACPWAPACAALADGNAAELPRRSPRPERPLRRAVAFWAERGDGAILLRRRPDAGLLGGMMELPSTQWRTGEFHLRAARREAPMPARWRRLPGVVAHGFTHFRLETVVLAGIVEGPAPAGAIWCSPGDFGDYALSSLTRKILRHAQAASRPN